MRRRPIVRLLLWLLAGPVALANTFVATGPFPGDTRAAVTMPGPPWRCIGRLALPNRRFMTATLVGPSLILTAAHGLVHDGRFKPGSFFFSPDAGNPHNQANDLARATRAWVGSFAPDQEPNVHADWALLQLDKNLGAAYGTLAVEDVDDAGLASGNRALFLSSYNRDFESGQMAGWQTGCRFLALNPVGYLLHDFSTDNGASGAPIFYFPDWNLRPGARIIALNVAEKTTQGETLYGVPFALRVANVGIAAHEFFPTLSRVLAGSSADPSYPLP